MKPRWKYVAIYVFVALSLSAPVQLGYLDAWFAGFFKGGMFAELSYLLAGISTLGGATVVTFFHKDLAQEITLFGPDKVKNILIALLPIIAFSIVGVENETGMNIFIYGFLYAFINTIYAFCEEFGWRWYLQNALIGINKHVSYLLIGCIWWIWHVRFETAFDLYVFPFICLGGGYLLGKLAEDSGSILPVVSMHALMILLTNSGSFTSRKIAAIVIVVLLWILLEKWRGNK